MALFGRKLAQDLIQHRPRAHPTDIDDCLLVYFQNSITNDHARFVESSDWVSTIAPRQRNAVDRKRLAESGRCRDHHNWFVWLYLRSRRNNDSGAALWVPPRLVIDGYPDYAALLKSHATASERTVFVTLKPFWRRLMAFRQFFQVRIRQFWNWTKSRWPLKRLVRQYPLDRIEVRRQGGL